MTAFPGSGTALDRVGGRLALEAVLRDKVGPGGVDPDLGVEESPRHFSIILSEGSTGQVLAELRSVEVARSNAIRTDQLDLLAADVAELRPIVAELLEKIREDAIPEGERRAMDGNR